MEMKERYDNLDKWVSRDSVPNIWVDAPKAMIQESNEEASKAILELEVDT